MMQKNDVRDPSAALAYLTDCTLATVCGLAGKKSAPKAELSRQISMAQRAIDWMDDFGVSYAGTRAEDVSKGGGSVHVWAEQFKPAPDAVLNERREAVFQALCGLPADHPFWRNDLMFTRAVFTQESRQMQDSEAFWTWATAMPKGLVQHLVRFWASLNRSAQPQFKDV
jgi:hypothetical protein